MFTENENPPDGNRAVYVNFKLNPNEIKTSKKYKKNI